jgi:hypothetical protein
MLWWLVVWGLVGVGLLVCCGVCVSVFCVVCLVWEGLRVVFYFFWGFVVVGLVLRCGVVCLGLVC